jgi:hypothetical protein
MMMMMKFIAICACAFMVVFASFFTSSSKAVVMMNSTTNNSNLKTYCDDIMYIETHAQKFGGYAENGIVAKAFKEWEANCVLPEVQQQQAMVKALAENLSR